MHQGKLWYISPRFILLRKVSSLSIISLSGFPHIPVAAIIAVVLATPESKLCRCITAQLALKNSIRTEPNPVPKTYWYSSNPSLFQKSIVSFHSSRLPLGSKASNKPMVLLDGGLNSILSAVIF